MSRNNTNSNNNNGTKHEVGHFEIPADNVDGLRSFYSSLFGWHTRILYDKKCRD